MGWRSKFKESFTKFVENVFSIFITKFSFKNILANLVEMPVFYVLRAKQAGAETGGRAGAWSPYGSQIYIEHLNFD